MESSATAPVNVLKMELSTSVSFVDDFLVEKLRTLAFQTIRRAFPESPRANDTAFIRQLANSLSGTGKTGLDRTQKALEPLFTSDDPESLEYIAQVSAYLRSISSGLRKARTFLAHQSKCVRGVLASIEDNPEFEWNTDDVIRWGSLVADAWAKQGNLDEKNKRLYLFTWLTFVRQAFAHPKSGYREYLFERVTEILAKAELDSEIPDIHFPEPVVAPSLQNYDELVSDQSGFVFNSEFPYESALEANHEPNSSKVYFTPQSYNEAPEIALSYKNNNAVMVDMRLLNSTDSQRIMDFLLGMKMVTDGSLKRVKKHLFVLTPKAVTNINFQNADEFAFTS